MKKANAGLNRRDFLSAAIALTSGVFTIRAAFGDDEPEVGVLDVDAEAGKITLYDTNAMALYFDGSLGPQTGVITVQYVEASQEITLDFWHGHNGILHRYTVTPDHFTQLKQLKRVYLETTIVADHSHKLFIDPTDARYRVPGAKPVVIDPDVVDV